jgi:YidC/Oxa1 family membrane protein insertase
MLVRAGAPVMTFAASARRWLPALLLGLVLLVLVAACAPAGSGSPGASPAVTPTPAGAIALRPASPGADPFSLLAWLFTPIFQLLFIGLVLLYEVAFHNIAIAIVLLTIILRVVLIPVFRKQTVSTRRMQLLGPEIKEIQRRYKGDRVKITEATQALYKDRGVNPASGCLPLLLTFFLLIPMYQVFSQGLQNYDVQPMVDPFGLRLVDLDCPSTPIIATVNGQAHVTNPCLNPVAFGVNWGVPEVIVGQPGAILSGLSLLAVISSLLQFVQSRMTLPKADPKAVDDQNTRIQRQMAYFLPFISLVYGSILPAGLFLYWIVTTIFGIIQQYLIIGWGGMFPLFGWDPAFAKDHTPRFPVPHPEPKEPSKRPPGQPNPRGPINRATSAEKTIRPRERGRQGRRGRRR